MKCLEIFIVIVSDIQLNIKFQTWLNEFQTWLKHSFNSSWCASIEPINYEVVDVVTWLMNLCLTSHVNKSIVNFT